MRRVISEPSALVMCCSDPPSRALARTKVFEFSDPSKTTNILRLECFSHIENSWNEKLQAYMGPIIVQITPDLLLSSEIAVVFVLSTWDT